jgi:hypothetical protein
MRIKARLSALTAAAETPNLDLDVGEDDGLVEGEEDDEDDLPGTPEERDLDDESEEQIAEMLEKFIEFQDEEDAEGDGAQRRHQEQNNDLEDADLGGGDAMDISPSVRTRTPTSSRRRVRWYTVAHESE